ncbi:fumarate/nitrate reduction transcriptional regulator Fnr [Acidihalobacter ferrooxydans]|uniref:fumarate/nitrate reduction transcriptional regulator Fnr n=1 Tax=Acidihalobacter ferrooxydans TaxID=1765967 RepID=UPI0018DCF3E1|nr:fumarate/nitrate reduction transcriptional regulator Fnr [Acidihalobacter ferrooxydans]
MKSHKVITLQSLSRACSDCRLQDLCLPIGISREDIDRLDSIVNRRRPLQRGTTLYDQGQHFDALYAVRSGSIKSFTRDDDGTEQINAFYLPGEILGLDAINANSHPGAAVALETTSVCELPFDRLHVLAQHVEGLQHQLLRIMSREINADERFMRVLANRNAEARLAGFLLNLSARYSIRGYSSTEFNLSMSRNDIGNYLGLAMETVSRLFTRFQQDGLIEAHRKAIRILQREALTGLADGSTPTDRINHGHGPT